MAAPALTTIPTARAVLRSCAAPLLGYAVALASALGLMALLVLAIAIEEGGGAADDPASTVDIEAVWTLVGMPFQVVGMALGGSLGLGSADLELDLFAPPLLVTAVFAFAVHRLSRAAERARPAASTTERALLALAGAGATAVVVTVLTRLLAMRDDGTAMHAASVGLFFATLVLTAAAAMAGRQAVHGSLWPPFLPAEGRRAVHLVAQHLLVWVVLVTPLAALWVLVENGPEEGLYALVWGPTLALAGFALGHGGAVTAVGENLFLWDLGWAAGLALPLLAIVLALGAAVAWHLRRGPDPAVLAPPASWVALPVAYAGAGLVACVLSTVGISGVTAHGAYWLIPVLALWGGAIEGLSRIAAPALGRRLPPALRRRLVRGPAHAVPAPVAADAPAARIPMSPADRARARRALIGAGVVGGLGLVAVVGVSVVGATAFDPQQRAEDYLDAVVAGRADDALALAPAGTDATTVLLTDEVYAKAEDRITGYEITGVETDGDTATVTVDLEGVPDGDDVTFRLRADGRRGVLFRDWEVDGGLARQVTVPLPESSTTLRVNGVAVEAPSGGEVDLWALPGSYAFDPYGESAWLESGSGRTVVPAAETWGTYAEIDPPQPSPALRDHVDTALGTWLDGCLAATTLDPPDCPQDGYGSGDRQRNVRWELTTAPTLSWDGFDGTFPAELSSDVTGQATATYEYDASYGFGAPDWTTETEEADLYVTAEVDLVDDEPVVTFSSY
ncbi:hypothetical protein GUY44_20810 [Pimelobacter simplex]|uniref:Uncharacterized protein n=1 Tax=Nocardioides simplex TaxID=2045 RepID=A0A0A1DGE8_NOCSI|nr:hypothetical protein [Pimelobacter simplex]AIY16396.1 hypothetical protein KR76_05815 [Pimelobacter simplex]MCG8152936.1 hypothetical protein [Pimelobacter simplex]GEB11904.1 hypothetical protein NSI01_02190 [Pimelobacter simplex]SFN03226.1 hypothetical protein SAMN05421671_4764 [Pimelobacter simplex]